MPRALVRKIIGCMPIQKEFHLPYPRILQEKINGFFYSSFDLLRIHSNGVADAKLNFSSATRSQQSPSLESLRSEAVLDDNSAVAPSRAGPDGSAPRFYKKASYAKLDDGSWVVTLDGRTLKTPAKKELRLPTEALALAVAAEWESQEGRMIRPFTMPLMKLAATAIDQIPTDREKVIQTLIKYFHCDSLICRAPNSLLSDKQTELWDPLLDWAATEIGSRPVTSSSLFVPNQPEDVVSGVQSLLRSSSDWQLAAIDSVSGAARSLTVSLAVVKGRLHVEEAIAAVRLEEDLQVEEWGFVEGGHDVDVADLRVRLSAASVFVRLLNLV